MNTTNRQAQLIEVLHSTCNLRPSWLTQEFAVEDEPELGNFYHFILHHFPGGEWVYEDYRTQYACGGKMLDLDEGDDFPRSVEEYYGAAFPLELEPWADSYLKSFILPRYAWLRSPELSLDTKLELDTFDDVLCLTKFSAAQAQAIVLELIYKAESTHAWLFKPHNWSK